MRQMTARLRAMTFDAFYPRRVMRMSLDLMSLSAETFRLLNPGRNNHVVWQEFKNKLQAFDLFENVDSVLNLPGGTEITLMKFIELCQHSSRSGYVEVACEALGLVTRNLYSHLVQVVDRQLHEIDEKLAGYFWHGVGRAIYFAPTNFLPFNNSPWRAVEMAQREPPHEVGRLNALVGLVWALTLVNIYQPKILETLLRRHGRELSQQDALANGVSSAVIIWLDSTGDHSCLDALFQHRPDSDLNRLWTEQVLQPGQNALQRFYPVIKKQNWLGEVFQYQSLPEL